MGPEEILPAELESLLSFWAEAGVDYALEEAAQDRLAPRAARQRPAAGDPPAPAAAGVLVDKPASAASQLAARANVLATRAPSAEALDDARAELILGWMQTGPRFIFAAAPWRRGPLDAPVAVVTDLGCDSPESGDQILKVEEARLFAAMAQGAALDEKMLVCALAPALSGDRTHDPDALSLLQPFILRLLDLAQHRLVLVLGAGAAQALGSDLNVSQTARTFGTLSLRSGSAPALFTLHPRFLLRQPLGKKRVWADLLMVKARLNAR